MTAEATPRLASGRDFPALLCRNSSPRRERGSSRARRGAYAHRRSSWKEIGLLTSTLEPLPGPTALKSFLIPTKGAHHVQAEQTEHVFAHGIWADGSSFSKLIPTFRQRGTKRSLPSTAATAPNGEALSPSGRPRAP